ncbi:MAG: family 78 glycoside hydrolase catalytic domain [Phycisphaerae bacterium]|nr:family 78 glycoside hydrolase catalytic domain [Phycisphaerae bacterium]
MSAISRGVLLSLAMVMIMSLVSDFVNAAADAPLAVQRLRCEYLVNPLGIDVACPRLSWVPRSDQRGQRQTAYQVLAASSADELAADKGDLWDTGKVVSDQSAQVVYGGRVLASGQRAWWKVRLWDAGDRPSAWSEPAFWEMGLLNVDDWKGQWLSAQYDRDQVAAPFVLEEMRWIWLAKEDFKRAPKDRPRFFRRSFELPAGRTVLKARLILAVSNRYELAVNDQVVKKDNGLWQLDLLDVTRHLTDGRNVLALTAFSEEKPAGVIGQLRVEFDGGEPLVISTDGTWKSGDEEKPQWRMAAFADGGWAAVREVGRLGDGPWGELFVHPVPQPAPLMRTVFELDKPIKRARAYICGLGYHELYLNGRKVGDHVLDPTFTNYDRRVLYVTHDVTDLLKQGRNAAGVMLGNGWYNMHTRCVWDFAKAPWRNPPCLKMQFQIEYTDGTSKVIATDANTWKVTAGPIVFDAVRNGESYDARLEKAGWDRVECDDAEWHKPVVVAGPKGRLVAQRVPVIRVIRTLKPVKLTEPKPGVFLFDAGQNLAGWTRIRLSGQAGNRITLKYGERLAKDGTLDQAKIGVFTQPGGVQFETYTLKGGGLETHEPRFVYYGFQYIEVSGWPGTPTLDDLDVRLVHTACGDAGSFECSSELFNKIQQCTKWSYVSNFVGIPTDCPHREKNGWTGDAQMSAQQAMYNFDNAAAYTHWIDSMRDAMKPDGMFPGIVPTGGWGYAWGNGPAWDSAYFIIPWYLYLYCGDTGILGEHYEGFKTYVDYLTAKADKGIVSIGLGDWVCLDQKTPEAVTSTGYYYEDARILAQIARLLGRSADADKYAKLAESIRRAFNEKFVNRETGQVATGSQTAQATALYWDLVDPTTAGKVVEQLVANIARCKDHINSGVLGSIYIPHALTRYGRADVAWKIASQTTYPSWGDWITQGANTMWEDWGGAESLNHIFFGDICAWFYQTLAGIQIDPQQPGFKHVIIRPHVLGDITWAKGETDTIRGKVASAWRLDGDLFKLRLTLPVGSTATVHLPAPDQDKVDVTEGGKPVAEVFDVKRVGQEQGRIILEVGSGQYEFASRLR